MVEFRKTGKFLELKVLDRGSFSIKDKTLFYVHGVHVKGKVFPDKKYILIYI